LKSASTKQMQTFSHPCLLFLYIQRCMECPNSFHITCISPKCQFHELALLCHEHAHTNKLPYLDYSSSIQGRVEAKVDEMFTSHGRKKNLVHSYSSSTAMMRRENKFLPGLKGDIFTQEQMDVSKLLNGTEMVVTSGFFPTFYFPVDIKNEVRCSSQLQHVCILIFIYRKILTFWFH